MPLEYPKLEKLIFSASCCLCHAGLGGRESRLVYCKQMTPGSCNDHQRTLTSVRVKELHCRIVFWSRMAWMVLLPAGGDSILWFSAEFFGSRMNSYSCEAKQEDPSKNKGRAAPLNRQNLGVRDQKSKKIGPNRRPIHCHNFVLWTNLANHYSLTFYWHFNEIVY